MRSPKGQEDEFTFNPLREEDPGTSLTQLLFPDADSPLKSQTTQHLSFIDCSRKTLNIETDQAETPAQMSRVLQSLSPQVRTTFKDKIKMLLLHQTIQRIKNIQQANMCANKFTLRRRQDNLNKQDKFFQKNPRNKLLKKRQAFSRDAGPERLNPLD